MTCSRHAFSGCEIAIGGPIFVARSKRRRDGFPTHAHSKATEIRRTYDRIPRPEEEEEEVIQTSHTPLAASLLGRTERTRERAPFWGRARCLPLSRSVPRTRPLYCRRPSGPFVGGRSLRQTPRKGEWRVAGVGAPGSTKGKKELAN